VVGVGPMIGVAVGIGAAVALTGTVGIDIGLSVMGASVGGEFTIGARDSGSAVDGVATGTGVVVACGALVGEVGRRVGCGCGGGSDTGALVGCDGVGLMVPSTLHPGSEQSPKITKKIEY
jgi:hypothetical protein